MRGLDSAEMAACPGFDPEVVPVGAEHVVGSGLSCRHLRPQRDRRRPGAFVAACTHPDPRVPELALRDQSPRMTYSTAGALRSVFDT